MANPTGFHGTRAGALALLILPLWCASPARADSGVAFLELGGFHLFMISVFVVWLEAWVLKGMFKIGFGKAAGLSGLVNAASYLAGLTANVVSYMLLVPIMGPFSYFPDYGIRPLFGASAEALGEPPAD